MAFHARHSEAHHRAALDLVRQALGMKYRSAVRDPHVVEDVELAGLKIQLNLDETAGNGRDDAFVAQVVLGHTDQTGARQAGHGHARDIVDVPWGLFARELASQFDGTLSGRRVGEVSGRIVRGEYGFIADVVVLGRTAEIHGGNLLEFRHGIHGRHVVGARAGKRRIAAGLGGCPGQTATAVAALDDTILPVLLQELGRDPGGGGVGVGAEVAATGVNVQNAIGRYSHQAVVTVAAGGVETLADADADDLRTIALPAPGALFLPVEQFRTLHEGFVLVGAGDRTLSTANLGVVARRIDAPYRELIDAQLPGGLVEDRFHGFGDLVLARSALGPSRRCIRLHWNAPVAHGQWLIKDGDRVGGGIVVAPPGVRSILVDDGEVQGGDAAIRSQSHSNPTLETGPRRAETVLLGTGDAQHHRPAGLLAQQCRYRHDRVGPTLGAESPTAGLGDVHEVLRIDSQQPGESGNHRGLTLG